MKANMGRIDRYVRGAFAAIIVGLYLFHVLDGTVAIILLVIAGLFVITSFCKVCPAYLTFGLNTNKKKK